MSLKISNLGKGNEQLLFEIEKLRKVNQELHERAELYRVLIEQSPDSIVIHDLEGKILFINPSSIEMFRSENYEEIFSRNAFDLVHPDSRYLVKNGIMELIESYKKNILLRKKIEHKLIRPDGSEFYGEVYGAALPYKGNLVIQAIIRDVTRRKQAEDELQNTNNNLESIVKERTKELLSANMVLKKEIAERKLVEEQKEKIQTQLLQAQKMEIIGRFASGIAHDFDNITTIIKTLSGLALAEVSKGCLSSKLIECLEIINATTERSTNITRQLLISARERPSRFNPINLNSTIDNMSIIFKHILNKNIVVRSALAGSLWEILADKGNVDQIIMNLVLNARDSMGLDGGMIYIKTENIIINDEVNISGMKPGKLRLFSQLCHPLNAHRLYHTSKSSLSLPSKNTASCDTVRLQFLMG